MIAFACGIALGSAFGACMMGWLWANARDRRVPSPGPAARRASDTRVKKMAPLAATQHAMLH